MHNFNQKLKKTITPLFLFTLLLGFCSNGSANTVDESLIINKDVNHQIEGSYKDIYSWYKRGNEFYRQGKYLESISFYEKAIQLDSTFDLALNGKGWALRALKQYTKAHSAFEQATILNPDSDKHWQGKGNTLYYLGRFQESLEAYDMSLKINYNSHDSWIGKSWTLGRLKKYKHALEAADNAIAIKNKSGNAWLAKGLILYETERYFEARIALQESLAIEPNNKSAQNFLKLAERQLNKKQIT